MSDILSNVNESMEPTVCPLAIECDFTVERIDGLGGMGDTRRVTFKGYATDEVCAALVNAIGMVLTDESEDSQ